MYEHMESSASCTSSKERWMDICKNSDFMTPVTLVQVILVRTLTSDFWVDWALLPLSTMN